MFCEEIFFNCEIIFQSIYSSKYLTRGAHNYWVAVDECWQKAVHKIIGLEDRLPSVQSSCTLLVPTPRSWLTLWEKGQCVKISTKWSFKIKLHITQRILFVKTNKSWIATCTEQLTIKTALLQKAKFTSHSLLCMCSIYRALCCQSLLVNSIWSPSIRSWQEAFSVHLHKLSARLTRLS